MNNSLTTRETAVLLINAVVQICCKTQNNLLSCGGTRTAKHFVLMERSKEQSATIITVLLCDLLSFQQAFLLQLSSN